MKNKLLGFLLGLSLVVTVAIAQDWYQATGKPVARSLLNSADLRTEFASIESDIADKLPALTGNGDKVVVVNSGGTALTVASTGIAISTGGTGATTAAGARTNLGVAIGSDVQAWDAELDEIAALADTDSNFIVGNGSAWVAETALTARTSLGVGTTDSPRFNGVNIGAVADTTLTRVSAGVVAVEGATLGTTATGSYTGVVVGCTSDPGPTVTWSRSANIVTISVAQFTCTSNTTSLLINGAPAAIWMTTNRGIIPVFACRDNGSTVLENCGAQMGTSGQITFYFNSTVSTGYTASGNKGVPIPLSWTYMLD